MDTLNAKNINTFHGYKTVKDVNANKYLTDKIAKIVESTESLPKELDFKRKTKFGMKMRTEGFMYECFGLHQIGYFPQWLLLALIKTYNFESIDEMIDIYNKKPFMIEPFKLPIKYIDEYVNYGKLKHQLLLSDEQDILEKIYSKINIYYTHIELSKHITDISITTYIHEIAHTQIDSHKGSIEDLTNREVISIFLELLYASYYKELLDFIVLKRADHLAISYDVAHAYQFNSDHAGITLPEYNDNKAYIVSIVKAFKMLSDYLDGNDVKKIYMLSCIQKVFDGKITVEDCLDAMDVSFNNSLDDKYIKRLIKEK